MSASTEQAAQRAYLAQAARTVTDVGVVHNRPRYGDAYDHWIADIGGVPRIRAWEIGLSPEGVRTERTTQAHRHRYRGWLIRGYVGLEDDNGADAGSYHHVTDLAGDIADAIDSDRTWDGSALDTVAPTQVAEPVVLTIGSGALCWGVTLSVVAYTVVSP